MPRACLLALLFLTPPSAAAAGPAKPVSFINDVAPILKEKCYACHDAKKRSGKLEMTSYAKLPAGGFQHDPIHPRQPGRSPPRATLPTPPAQQKAPPPEGKGPGQGGGRPPGQTKPLQ